MELQTAAKCECYCRLFSGAPRPPFLHRRGAIHSQSPRNRRLDGATGRISRLFDPLVVIQCHNGRVAYRCIQLPDRHFNLPCAWAAFPRYRRFPYSGRSGAIGRYSGGPPFPSGRLYRACPVRRKWRRAIAPPKSRSRIRRLGGADEATSPNFGATPQCVKSKARCDVASRRPHRCKKWYITCEG